MKNNILPNVWGPHGWKFIHYVALGYPDEPTDADKRSYKKFYESLRDILPCQSCADHYRDTIHMYPVDGHLSSREELLRWSFDIHNTVNKRIGKPTLTYEKAIRLYTHKQFHNTHVLRKCMLVVAILFIIYLLVVKFN